jgi:hypothetical protein
MMEKQAKHSSRSAVNAGSNSVHKKDSWKSRYWSATNPILTHEIPLHDVKVGIEYVSTRIIGPIVLSETINPHRCDTHFLTLYSNTGRFFSKIVLWECFGDNKQGNVASSFDIFELILPCCLCGTSKNKQCSSDPCTEDDTKEIFWWNSSRCVVINKQIVIYMLVSKTTMLSYSTIYTTCYRQYDHLQAWMYVIWNQVECVKNILLAINSAVLLLLWYRNHFLTISICRTRRSTVRKACNLVGLSNGCGKWVDWL